MRLFKKSVLLLAVACIALGLGGCDRGPMEKGGKEIDDAVEDVTK